MPYDTAPPALTVLPLTLRMHALDLALPTGMGALWRSAWGRALQAVDRLAFEAFFGAHAQARLVALCPPLSMVRPGTVFEWRLTLFGPAAAHAPAVVASARELARLGVGERRQRALLLDVSDDSGVCWQFDRGWLRDTQPIDSAQWWAQADTAADSAAVEERVTLECQTPVALKDDNDWLLGAPEWSVWVRRLLGRTAQLSQAAQQSNPIGIERACQWLSQAHEVRCIGSQIRLVQLERVSARTGQRMRVPTQLGRFTYAPVSSGYAPLLRWMELIQVGAKTAFGCGVVRARLHDAQATPPAHPSHHPARAADDTPHWRRDPVIPSRIHSSL